MLLYLSHLKGYHFPRLLLGLLIINIVLIQFQVCSQGVSSLESRLKCDPGWYGFGCNSRFCPSGLAWNPGEKNSVQPDTGYATCSNAGYCDSRSGECKCFKGFTGAACERSFCPGHCSGHGLCVPLSDLQYENIEYFIREVVARNPKAHEFRENYQPDRKMIAIGG